MRPVDAAAARDRTVGSNWLDRVIAEVAPRYALQRLAARRALGFSARGGGYYQGGRSKRRALAAWLPGGGSADQDTVPDLPDLRADTRGLERVSPIGGAAIERLATAVIGPGLTLQAQVDRELLGLDEEAADAWQRSAEREFHLWADSENCDASRAQDFMGLQDVAYRGRLQSGDCFAVKRFIERPGSPYALALQLYEADQIETPQSGAEGRELPSGNRIVGGIELDGNNEAVAVWIRDAHPGELGTTGKRTWVRREIRGAVSGRVIIKQLLDRRRIAQTRGVPLLAPVIEQLRQLTTYSEAELYAAVIGAMIAVVYKGSSGQQLPASEPTGDTGAQAADKDYKLAAGNILELGEGDEVSVPQLGRPNSGFDPFFVAVVRQIGAVVGIPFEVLIQHFTASYSASRAALEQFWQYVRRERAWFARTFCKWVYVEFLHEAIGSGRLAAPGFFQDPLIRAAWCRHSWIGPARISIDPAREAQWLEKAEDRGWKTAAEITAETTGGDWDLKIDERGREERRRQAAGAGRSATAAGAPGQSSPGPSEDRPENETEEP